MSILDLQTKIQDAEKTLQETDAEAAVPYIIDALKEVARILLQSGLGEPSRQPTVQGDVQGFVKNATTGKK